MNNLNSVIIEGNLTRDPELSYNSSGKAVEFSIFSIAVDHYYKQKKETSFFEVKVEDLLGEIWDQYLKKGRRVRVIGRLKQERWQDGEGRNGSKVIIVAGRIELFITEKKTEAGGAEAEEEASDDDLPF